MKNADNFLANGGEMGERIRAHDWSSSTLGVPAEWPASLKTAVGLMLNTRHPIYIFWGPTALCLYNDAYSASIGPERHPGSLGKPGADVWEEIWPVIGPQIQQVMAGQGATWHENQLLPITRHGVLEDVYWTYSYAPIIDDDAPHGVGGVIVICTETTQQVLAEKRQAEAVIRQRQQFEQAPGFMIIMSGPEHVVDFVNLAHRRVFGSDDWLGRPIREAFPSIEGQGFYELLDNVFATGETFEAAGAEARYRKGPDEAEETHFLSFVYAPVHGADGEITGVFCEGFDITDAYLGQSRLSEREEQLRLATEMAEVGLWDVDLLEDTLFWPPRVKAMFGISPDVPVTMADFYAGLHPQDFEATSQAFAAAADPVRRGLYDVEYRTIGAEDGIERWVAAKGRGVFDAKGRCIRVIGTAIDITQRKASEQRFQLVLNELNHRVKNSLATVQGIVAQTLKKGVIDEAVRSALVGRIVALAHAHDVLTEQEWNGADLRELAQQVAAPYQGLESSPFRIDGPSVNLPVRLALGLAMVFHELATNATKYGALSLPHGVVHLSWTSQATPEGVLLNLVWREEGGPPVRPPKSQGFGTRMIERGLLADLGGAALLDFASTGVCWSIEAVLTPDAYRTAMAT